MDGWPLGQSSYFATASTAVFSILRHEESIYPALMCINRRAVDSNTAIDDWNAEGGKQ